MRAEGPKYIFDTSSLNRIRRQADSNRAWATVIGLIESGRACTVPEVMDELEKVNPAAFEKLTPHRRDFVLRRNNARYVSSARIWSKYPTMSKASKPHDSADPWVVGVAKEDGLVVVTNEKLKGGGQKMPKVCRKENVSWLSLEELMEIEEP